jgi:transposase-like protein
VKPEGVDFVISWKEDVPDAMQYHCHSCGRDFTFSRSRGYYVGGKWIDIKEATKA